MGCVCLKNDPFSSCGKAKKWCEMLLTKDDKPCSGNGTCIAKEGGAKNDATCKCNAGFEGKICEKTIAKDCKDGNGKKIGS